ncbi:hypothetical protein ACTXT7_008155 [Hymenolepis weldensis]
MLPGYADESSPQTIQRSTSRPNMATSELFSALSASVWSEGKKRAESAYQNYAKIDSLRPFFDVDPKEVLGRILNSVNPRPPYNLDATNTDLYGPFMACLTLIAVILFEMKLSNHQVAMMMWANISKKTPRLAGCFLAFVLHMFFVIYLHFAYHTIVQVLYHQQKCLADSPFRWVFKSAAHRFDLFSVIGHYGSLNGEVLELFAHW